MKKRLWIFILLTVSTFFLAYGFNGCSSGGGGGDTTDTGDSGGGGGGGGGPGGGGGGSTDTCGNDIGNGATVISGPSTPDTPEDNDSIFRGMTVDPTDPDILYVGTERNGVLKSTDGGLNWTRLRTGIRTFNSGYPEVWSVSVDPNNTAKLLLGTTDSPGPATGSNPSSFAGIYRSADGGTNWARANCGLSNSKIGFVMHLPDVTDGALATVNAGNASFGGGGYYTGGIYRTTDGGDNWTAATLPAGGDRNDIWVIRRSGATPPYTYYSFGFDFNNSANNIGFIKSTDDGQTWTAFAPTIQSEPVVNFDVSADGQVIFAQARDSFEFQRSLDGGANWVTLSAGTGINVCGAPQGPVLLNAGDPDQLVYAGNDKLCHITNARNGAGITGIQVVDDADDLVFEWLVAAPSDPNRIYAMTRGYHLYVSTDGGANFTGPKDLRADVINTIP